MRKHSSDAYGVDNDLQLIKPQLRGVRGKKTLHFTFTAHYILGRLVRGAIILFIR